MLQVREEVQAMKEQITAWYEALHKRPEPSFEEYETTEFIREKLEAMGGYRIWQVMKTGLIAEIEGGKPGPVIALRADIDCLRMQELTDAPFKSEKEGLMHGCGHDGHTTMLLAAAAFLSAHKEELVGTYRLLFQPAEELPPGGALEYVKAGVLDGVDYVLGQHVMPFLPTGQFGIKPGPIMAASDRFYITIHGSGGHASQPHLTIDPVAVGIQIGANLQMLVSREVDPLDQLVVSLTNFHAGSGAVNVIPGEAELSGSVRTFNEDTRQMAAKRIKEIAESVAAAHRATVTVKYTFGYDATVSDEYVASVVRDVAADSFGEENLPTITPLMGAEDFSRYLKVVPGCFWFLGIGNEEKGYTHPIHHGCFRIDPDALPLGAELLLKSAFALAERHESRSIREV